MSLHRNSVFSLFSLWIVFIDYYWNTGITDFRLSHINYCVSLIEEMLKVSMNSSWP